MDPKRPPDTLPTSPRFGGGGGGGGSQIPPNPRSSGVHRRAHSETFFRLPDDLLFDSDPDFSLADIDFPSLSDDNISGSSSTAAPAISNESGGISDPSTALPPVRTAGGGAHHLRSLSVDAAFFEGLGFQVPGAGGSAVPEKMPGHRHSSSMDGATSPFEGESTPDYAKKAMAADRIEELALIDPKRAKRILANRQSAARSKERKIRYTSELERKVQTLQTEATTLSAQLTLLQRDSTGLSTENRELKLRLQAMEQQAHLRDALNEALREEVQRLKIATGQIPNSNGNPFNRGFQQSASPFFSHPQLHPNHGSQHAQQLHSAPFSSHQAHLNSAQLQTPSNGQAFSGQSVHDSMDLM